MRALACALTMVKDDYFFLQKWVAHYGAAFGRDALYVVSHGGDPEVDRITEGCNVIRIPGGFDKNFDARRWRMLSNFTNGLRSYYDFVVVGDVDEYLVVDPKLGLSLADFLSRRKAKTVITPIGIEIVHRADVEPGGIEDGILGPRRYGRYSSFYSKPCIVSRQVRLSRGGHYTDVDELKVFRNLYLFHMKYCDRAMTVETMRRRSALADETVDAEGNRTSMISDRWYADEGEETAEIDKLAALPVREDFDLDDRVRAMHESWGPRDGGFHHFQKAVGRELHTIPERFFGTI